MPINAVQQPAAAPVANEAAGAGARSRRSMQFIRSHKDSSAAVENDGEDTEEDTDLPQGARWADSMESGTTGVLTQDHKAPLVVTIAIELNGFV